MNQIPLTARIEIAAQVATALASAHSIGVLHKDVKPSNVLVQTSQNGIQAQLADFGIGQLTERERLAAAGITVLGMSERTFEETPSSVSGTRLYMAPELLEGRSSTLQTDIYALGVILYQLVVGDLGRALGPGWRRDVDDAFLAEDIASFVDRSPEHRPVSAHEVARRLRSLEERRHQHQANVEAKEAFETSQRKRKIYQAVAATSVIGLMVVSALAVWAVRAGQEQKRAREATEGILAFMVSLFELTDPFESRREPATAREILDWGTERVESEFEDQPLVRARLLDTFGGIYYSLGLYEKAKPLLEQALRTRRERLGRHPEVVTSLYHLSRVLRGMAAYEAAEKVARESLEMARKLLGVEHPQTLSSMHILAEIFRNLGDTQQARAMHEQTLSIRQRVLGNDHPSTLESMNDLALSFLDLGNFKDAKRLQEQALETQERVLGAEHPYTLVSMNSLAVILFKLEEFDQAKELQQRALQILERRLGLGHPSTLSSKNNLAHTLKVLGEVEAAKKLFQQAYDIVERSLGSEHPRTTSIAVTLLRIAQEKNDAVETSRWIESLQWLAGRGEKTIASARQRKHRDYVLQVLSDREQQ